MFGQVYYTHVNRVRALEIVVFSVFTFVAGILLFQQLPLLPGHEWLHLIAVSVLVCALGKLWRVSFFLLGFAWAFWVASDHLAHRLPEILAGKDLVIKGKIHGLPQQDETKVRFDFLLNTPQPDLPEKLRLSWYYPEQKIAPGQVWRFTVRLKPPHGNFNPGGFDYERWLFIKGIGATGYVRNKPAPVLISQKPRWQSISVWRQHIADQVDQLSENGAFSGIIKALIIGDRFSISQNQWQILRKTGTVHLMAISGLHIGLISGMAYLLVLRIWARTGSQRWLPANIAALAAIFVAICYAALAGFSIPTQRALIMLCVAMVAILWQRHVRPFHTLAIAMMLVVGFDPLAVLSAGFWLSFLAVAIIIYTLGGRLRKSGYWRGAIKTHLATALGLSPLLILFFQQTSLIAPLANLIAVPVVGLVVVPLSLSVAVLLFIAPGLAQILLRSIEFVLQRLWEVLSFLSDSPFALLEIPQPSIIAIVLAMLGVLLLLAPKGIPGRWLSACLLLPLFLNGSDRPLSGEVKMTLLDVGQGLSTVIQTSNHVLVFDAGAKYSQRFDSGASVVYPFLKFNNLNQIDSLVISHGDNDHIGGADYLINQISVKQIITSVPEKFVGLSAMSCVAGFSWQWDGVDFDILSPNRQAFASENDNSCVIMITAVSGKILLTGDIEAAAESWLVDTYGEQLQADVLVAPHHGSKTSSTVNFLRKVRAKYVLIPAGYRNRFGFPHQEVLERYKKSAIQPINIAETGAITIILENRFLNVETWRNTQGKYWNK
jgi:competence protein ComEC